MDKVVFDHEQLANLAYWLKVISEPNRLMLLEKIIQGVQCNCELSEALHMSNNLISHHLGVLREAGLVEVERDPIDARWIYYSVNANAVGKLKQVFNAFFDQERIRPGRPTCRQHLLGDSTPNLLKLNK